MFSFKTPFTNVSSTTVQPPNSRFLGPEIFREFEIREFKIHDFPPNSLYNY